MKINDPAPRGEHSRPAHSDTHVGLVHGSTAGATGLSDMIQISGRSPILTSGTQAVRVSPGERALIFFDSVAAALAPWIDAKLPELLSTAIQQPRAKSDDQLTKFVIDSLNKELFEVVDEHSAHAQRIALLKEMTAQAFTICKITNITIYLCVGYDFIGFALNSKFSHDELLRETIRRNISGLAGERLRSVYELVSGGADGSPRGDRRGPETVDPNEANYLKRPTGETAPKFIQRVYRDWLDTLSRDQLRRLNPAAYRGLYAYEAKNGRLSKERDGFTLKTRSQRIDEELQHQTEIAPSESERRRRRLREAAARRSLIKK